MPWQKKLLLVRSVFCSGGNCHDAFQIKVSTILMDFVFFSLSFEIEFLMKPIFTRVFQTKTFNLSSCLPPSYWFQQQVVTSLASNSGTVVEYLSHHSNIKGSCLASVNGTRLILLPFFWGGGLGGEGVIEPFSVSQCQRWDSNPRPPSEHYKSSAVTMLPRHNLSHASFVLQDVRVTENFQS